jgi:hypothetical protein
VALPVQRVSRLVPVPVADAPAVATAAASRRSSSRPTGRIAVSAATELKHAFQNDRGSFRARDVDEQPRGVDRGEFPGLRAYGPAGFWGPFLKPFDFGHSKKFPETIATNTCRRRFLPFNPISRPFQV